MLDAIKYIDRLRQTVKDTESIYCDYLSDDSLSYIVNRVKDIIRDYDREFNSFLNEMETLERQGKFKEEEEEGVRRGRETHEYVKKLNKKWKKERVK